MTLLSKILLLVTLCSFTLSTAAAGMLCDLSVLDNSGSQHDSDQRNNEGCHDEAQKHPSDDSQDDCCQDMSICHLSFSIVTSKDVLSQVNIIHSSVQKPENNIRVLNSSSPPERPPKHFA